MSLGGFSVGNCVLLADDEPHYPGVDPLYEIMQIDESREEPFRLEMCGSRQVEKWVDATALRAWDGFAIGDEVQLWSNCKSKPSYHGAYGKIIEIDFSVMTVASRQFQVETNKAERWWVPKCVLRRLANGAAAGPAAPENGAAAGPAAENRFVLSGPGNSLLFPRIDALESEVEAQKAKAEAGKAKIRKLQASHRKELDALQSTNEILRAGKKRMRQERDRIVKGSILLIDRLEDEEKEREALENAVRVAKRQRDGVASAAAAFASTSCVLGWKILTEYQVGWKILTDAAPQVAAGASGVGALFFM